MQLSFWERDWYRFEDAHVIIGSGIVGLSTAIEIKLKYPETSVIVLDQHHFPHGASTKNAGFACFGSVTEILDDLTQMSPSEVIEIVKMRWEGIKLLKERLEARGVEIPITGGTELFANGHFPNSEEINTCNEIMYQGTGVENYFAENTQSTWSGFSQRCIVMPFEGELHTAQMYNALYQTALSLEVKFLLGYAVENMSFDLKQLHLSHDITIPYHRLFICTNGFTRQLIPDIELYPARNHVLVTNELPDLKWSGVYHYDKGYYYFRRVGNRILLGGARNFDPEHEVTDRFEFNQIIQSELLHFLQNKLSPCCKVYPEYWWTGILGMGKSKFPIVRQLEEDVFIGVRLGGMGVAIGSYLGKKIVDLAFKQQNT